MIAEATRRVLRDYQQDAVDAVRAGWASGLTRVAVVLPTGAGKTDVIARIATDAAQDRRRVLILAHRGELIDQIMDRCRMHDPHTGVGRVQADTDDHHHPITVASSPTLASAVRRDRITPPDLVIVDECHHAVSDSYRRILDWAGCMDRTPTLGVTATMVRGDRRGLGDVWESVVFERDIAWAVGANWLVTPVGRVVVADHLAVGEVAVTRSGDLHPGQLGEMVALDAAQIVAAWCEHAADRITVAFCPSREAAVALESAFTAASVPVGVVLGDTDRDTRQQLYDCLAVGAIRVLVSVMVTTEGWDSPAVSCVLQARPTRLPGLYTQMVGRGLRPHPGKTDCLVLDVTGAAADMRLVSLTDLSPTAVVVDPRPCRECGETPCVCAIGDGGGGLRRAPARAATVTGFRHVDLLGDTTDRSDRYRWLHTLRGIPILAVHARVGVLWPHPEGGWMPGHCHPGGTHGVWLTSQPTDDATAAEVVQRWVSGHPRREWSPVAGWRSRPASQPQCQFAAQLGVSVPAGATAGHLSDMITVARASAGLDGMLGG